MAETAILNAQAQILKDIGTPINPDKYSLIKNITDGLRGQTDYVTSIKEAVNMITKTTPRAYMEHHGAFMPDDDGSRYVFWGLNNIHTKGATQEEAFSEYLYESFMKYRDDADSINADLVRAAAEEPPQEPEEKRRKPKITCVKDVQKEKMQFLIEPYVVKNNITVLAGEGGVGKTFVWVDIASAITQNKLPDVMGVPFNTKTPNADNNKVLYLTSEDSTAEILKERFEKAGANQDNLYFVSLKDEFFHEITLESTELEEIIKEVRPALCVLDPLQSFVKGKMTDRNNMRRQLDCLTRLGGVYGVSFLIIVHTNKLATSDARTKLSDSSDIWDKCRSVLFVGRTTEKNIRYLSQEKGNYTNDSNAQATHLFCITNGKIEERGTTDKMYYDFATESVFTKDTNIRDDAKDVILNALKEKEMLVSELDETVTAYGIKPKTLERAKSELRKAKKIIYRRESAGKDKGVQWYVSINQS